MERNNQAALFLHVLMAAILAFTLLSTPAQAQEARAPEGAPQSFADLADKLLPSVVTITTRSQAPERLAIPDLPEFPPGSPFGDFFEEFMRRQPAPVPREGTSLGSGFIYDAEERLVITNHHVVADAREITVVLPDGETADAELIGSDEKTDLAVLRINTTIPLKAVRFGDSAAMRVGDWVLAIGNPFGLGGTVTAGIISAKARDIGAGPYDDFLQTDAAINRGNSGGPMFNLRGEVIGINTAIFSPTGTSVGIGFAVPSNLAVPVVEQLLEFGRTKRGWLGVRIQNVNEEFAQSLGLEQAKGALIASVTPGGPAQEAGIEAGDVILSFDGKDIPEMRRLPRIVAETPVGRTVDVDVWHKGQLVKRRVLLGELEVAEAEGRLDEETTDRPRETSRLETDKVSGLSLAPLTRDLRQRFGVADTVSGVVIIEVEDGTDAAIKGLLPGDVIIEVNQETVSTAADVSALIDEARKRGRPSVLLMIRRENDTRFFAISVQDAG